MTPKTTTESAKKRCPVCGRGFVATGRQRGRKIYCSLKCYWRAGNAKKTLARQAKRKPRKCANPPCENFLGPSARANKLYCSEKCRLHAAWVRNLPKNRESQRNRYYKNRDKILADLRNEYALNPGKFRRQGRRYRREHGPELNKRRRERKAQERAIVAEAKRILALGFPQKSRKKPEAEKQSVQVADAVNAVIPRFAELIPLRRKQTKELIALGLSSNEIEALRMPGSRTATVAARYFISLERDLPYDTVAQYHKRSRHPVQTSLYRLSPV